MDGFSDLGGPLGYGDSTREKKWNSLHAQRGIGKGKGSRIIHIWFILHKYFLLHSRRLRGLMATSLDCHVEDPSLFPGSATSDCLPSPSHNCSGSGGTFQKSFWTKFYINKQCVLPGSSVLLAYMVANSFFVVERRRKKKDCYEGHTKRI